jgi:D-alanyl-D-alanine carboxypeptidase
MSIQNDIPVAQRLDESKPAPAKQTNRSIGRSLRLVPWWAYVLAVLAFISPLLSARLWIALNTNNPTPESQAQTLTTPEISPAIPMVAPFTTPASPNITSNASDNAASNLISSSNSTTAPTDAKPNTPADLFGHYPYTEAPAKELLPISRASDGYEIRLRAAAAKSYLQMAAAARAEGIEFAVISGFRSVSDQQQLFFEISKQRNQTPAQRAKVSAPPGYSEHHTGYAVDLGDADVPSANLSQSFEKTPAFQWLQNNAAKYGFEISFPPNNSQGVMYEPWHWRFVGDEQSLATFYKKTNRSSSFIQKP